MQEVRLDVWQFVRLMVRLEDRLAATGGIDGPAARGSDIGRIWSRWEDVWVDLDARLVDLGKHDMDGFAELMMNQEVVLEEVSQTECRTIARELDAVVTDIRNRLARTDDPSEIEDLTFERDELVDTIHRLDPQRRVAKAGRSKKAAGKQPGGKQTPPRKGAGKRPASKRPAGKRPAGKRGPARHR